MRVVAAGLMISLLVPAAASARAGSIAPPGNSAINQYVESVPTAKGHRPTRGISVGGSGKSGGSGGSGALSPATQQEFARGGADGAGAAALAQATAPVAATSRGSRASHAGHARSGTTPHRGPGSPGGSGAAPASSLAKALTGSATQGGLGPLLPAILIVSAIGGGVLALARHRRTT